MMKNSNTEKYPSYIWLYLFFMYLTHTHTQFYLYIKLKVIEDKKYLISFNYTS